ncbi:MAG: hypothetical protein J6S92_04465, partial [Oscillospiraceae bacterium]|nr:hypothetical protein [Oscillospiraceae bacterium]
MNRTNRIRRLTASAAAAVMTAVCCLPLCAAAEENAAAADDLYTLRFERETSYSDYYDMHIGEKRPAAEVRIAGIDYADAKDGSFSVGTLGGRAEVLVWDSAEGELTYEVDVPESGIYCVQLSYYAMESPSNQVEFSLAVDGELPFES